MRELFGVSLTVIAIVMMSLFAVVAVVVVFLALRNRIMFKLGVRNIPKRPAQTALIVLGLMLSTVLVTAAFSTGDTLVYTIRSVAVDALGNTDEIVTVPNADTAPDGGYFNEALVDRVREYLSDAPYDGLLPVIQEQVPLYNPREFLSAPSVTLFAPGSEYGSYTRLTDADGQAVSLDDLASTGGAIRVFVDKDTAEDLAAETGDALYLFVGGQPVALELAGIVEGASSTNFSFVLMPLAQAQAQSVLNKPGLINAIYISNSGGALDGARYSDEIEDSLKGPLEAMGFQIDSVKKSTLDSADMAGSVLTSIFVLFGLFSIAAGVLLIFLIFMMLAAARKSEMGMARAVGTKRSQLVQMFLFEGVVYDVMAAIVGVGLGVAVTRFIAGAIASIIPQEVPIDITFHVEPKSLIVAFTLGILVTFITVALSAWRVSRLNIVRAIRDIPEPVHKRVGRGTLGLGVAVGILGLMLSIVGILVHQAGLLYLGVSLIIISVALIARWRGVRERPVFTIAGLLLVVWSLLPSSVLDAAFGEMKMGIEMFFIVGITMVLGGIWAVSYNLDVIGRVLAAILGRVRSAAPVLRSAMAYPMKNRMRTGLTMAMFSVVIFSIVFMSVVIRANTALLSDTDAFAGGYDVSAMVSYLGAIPDIEQAIAEKRADPNYSEMFDPNHFEAIAGMCNIPLEIRQVIEDEADTESEDWKEYIVNGVDDAYLETNDFEFLIMADGYDSARDVWLALRDNPGLAVISAEAVPVAQAMGMSFGGGFMLEGIDQGDKEMSPIEVQIRSTIPGENGIETIEKNLTVIAVLKQVSFNYGVYTSKRTIDEVSPFPIPITTYLFKLSDGVDAGEMADSLQAAFMKNGMQATAIADTLKESSKMTYAINALMTGFMGLGLVVGIAALGVISTRAVVERRHEIGILRAIGFKRSSVQAAFLLESSIVATLGIIIGSVLALALSYQVLNEARSTMENIEFQMPWTELAIIAGVSWVASMLMTIIPAWQASKIYPAEALRYE